MYQIKDNIIEFVEYLHIQLCINLLRLKHNYYKMKSILNERGLSNLKKKKSFNCNFILYAILNTGLGYQYSHFTKIQMKSVKLILRNYFLITS